jgi:translocation and assembly module TamB
VAGQFGMALNSHILEFRDTDLQVKTLDTDLIEQLAPGVEFQVPGVISGTAKLDGPARAIRTDVNGTFDADRHPPFRFTIRGSVGAGESMTARGLHVTARGVPVSLAREFVKDMPLGGVLNADAVVSGSTATEFTGRATVTHLENGTESTIIARGSVAPEDSMRMRLDVDLAPVSLELAQRFAPSVELQGDITGTGKVSGTLRNLRTTLALQLPAGTMDVDGTFDLASEVPGYEATVQVRNVDARAIVPTMPVTSLNGVSTVVGRGTDPRTMDARVTMHLLDAMVDSTKVIEAVVVAAARDARLTVDTMRVRTPFATATATGTFGLVEGTTGTLTYGVDVTTLSGLQRWIATGDTSVVSMRPLVRQRAAAQVARGDSLRRVADSANIGAMATRRAGQPQTTPISALQASDALARDSIAGSVSVRGTVKGGIERFTAEGKATLNQLIWGGNEIGRGTADFTWADVRTPEAKLTAQMGVDSVRAAGFAFDSTHVKGTYSGGNGDLSLSIFPGDTAVYRLQAAYQLRTDEGEVRLQDVNLRFDSTAWVSTHESVVRWKGGGLQIDSLELRSRNGSGGGRILVHGEVPDRDPGHLLVRVDSLRVAPWLTLLQSNLPVDGVASVNAEMEGTRFAPRIRGSVALAKTTYRATPFPEFHSDFTYADQRLQFAGDLRSISGGGAKLASLKGELPIDLSFGGEVAKRTLDGPVSIDLEGDSIPLGPITEFVDAFSTVSGEAHGRIGVRGTWTEPRFEGAIELNVAKLGLREAGVTLTNSIGRVHMDGDRMVIDSLLAHSGGGWARITGSVTLVELDHPVADLSLVAHEARVLDNKKGQLVMSSNVTFKGPYDTLSVNGSMTVVHGLIRIPDPEEWKLINTGDPVVFAVVDTSFARELDVAPPSPLLKNANVNVRLEVKRGTWARSREANIEVFGDLTIERVSGDQEMSVTGALYSDYGDYELYGRRFRVERGSVRFTGTPANPVLQLVANHEVRQAGRAPFDIQVTIGGSLEQPNISLESKAQPTLTQSDLISFLAFGQSSTSLLQFEGSGFEGGGQSGSSLAGNVATLATRQLAGVALGALFAQLESDLTEKTAADVLNIKPADLPPGLTLGAVRSVAAGTQIEYGKYLDRNTFFVGTFRPTLTMPGATLERRFGSQTRARLSFEPRYLPQVPSLTSGLQPKVQQVLGALLFWTRSW